MKKTRLLLGCAIAALPVMPVAAQDAQTGVQTETGGGLGDIVVTARKVEENLQDIPVAVTAYSGDQLAQQNAVSTIDVARFTPGLTMRLANSTPASLVINMRGQVQADTLATLDPSVGTYVDEVYWARSYGLNADLLDVQSVQALKGPQGTLFGRNTTGGAVLFQTNDPNFDGLSGKVSATYGRFNERSGTAVLNAPLVDDVLAVRGAFQMRKRDGYSRDIGPVHNGVKSDERDEITARGKILFRPTDNLSILLSADYWRTDARAPTRRLFYVVPPVSTMTLPAMTTQVAALAAAAGCPQNYAPSSSTLFPNCPGAASAYPSTSGYGSSVATYNSLQTFIASIRGRPNAVGLDELSRVQAKTQTYSAKIALDTDFGEVKFIGAYRKFQSRTIYDLDGSPLNLYITKGMNAGDQISGELQITGSTANEAIDFAVGALAFHESAYDGSISVALANVAAAPYTSGDVVSDSIGAYAQASWHITDALTATGGLRYSIDDKQLTTHHGSANLPSGGFASARDVTDFLGLIDVLSSCAIPAPFTSLAQNCDYRVKDSFGGWSYTAGLDYKIDSDILVYAKTSKGFRSGGQNLRARTVATSVAFKPEIAFSHEAGLKTQFWNNRARFNLAAYYTKVKDIQRTAIVAAAPGSAQTLTLLTNAGKARFWGLEADLTVELVDNLVLSATGAIVRPKYLEFSERPTRTNLTGDRRSELFDTVPENTFTLAGTYTHEFGANNELILTANYSWTDKYALQPATFFVGDAAAVTVDPATGMTIQDSIRAASAAKATGLVGGQIMLRLDDRYELTLWGRNLTDNRSRSGALYLPTGWVTENVREPRTFGVTGTVKFGSQQ